TTSENAERVKAMAAFAPGERWLLVTSGYHMPRAMGAFRAAGLDLVAYPVDYRVGDRDLRVPHAVLSAGLQRIDLAAREWVGLLVYRITGRSTALFPAP